MEKSQPGPHIQYDNSREHISTLPIQLIETQENCLTTLNSVRNYRDLESSNQNPSTIYFDNHQNWQHSEQTSNLVSLENPDAIYHYRHNNPQIYHNNQYNENFSQNQIYYNHNPANMNIDESNNVHTADSMVHNNFQMYSNHASISPQYNSPLASTSTHFNMCQNTCNQSNENTQLLENYTGQKHRQHHLECLNKNSVKYLHPNQALNAHQIIHNDMHNGMKFELNL